LASRMTVSTAARRGRVVRRRRRSDSYLEVGSVDSDHMLDSEESRRVKTAAGLDQ
jgi:hypothetical protein